MMGLTTVMSPLPDTLKDWAQVDLSERFLVSGMFKDAALTAVTVLEGLVGSQDEAANGTATTTYRDEREREPADTQSQLLSHQGSEGGRAPGMSEELSGENAEENEEDEEASTVQCAGAVLVQAYNELDQHGELLDVMRGVFGSAARVPGQLFLTWVSLQVAAQEYALARTTLEEYLHVFRPSANGVPMPSINGSDHGYSFGERKSDSWTNGRLPPGTKETTYGLRGFPTRFNAPWRAAAKIYTVDVLTKGFGDATSAISWLQKGKHSLTPEEKETLIGHVERAAQARRPAPSGRSGASQLTTANGTLQSKPLDRFARGPATGNQADWIGHGGCKEDDKSEPLSSLQRADQKTSLGRSRGGEKRGGELKAGNGLRRRSSGEIAEIQPVEDGFASNSQDRAESSQPAGTNQGGATEAEAVGWEGFRKYPPWLVLALVWLKRQSMRAKEKLVHKGESLEVALQRGWDHILLNKQAVLGAVFGSLIFASAIKERALLSRLWRSLIQAFRQGLVDLWQLAFTVNLNPLAAVQPSSYPVQQPLLRY